MSHPEELGLKSRKPKAKDDSDPDILIIPDDYDLKSGQPPSPMWMVHIKEPKPESQTSTWQLILSILVVTLFLLALFAR
jgi:hypothetical protein